MERITATARNNIFQKIYRQIENSLSSRLKQKLDELLVVSESETFTAFDKLKSLSGKAGVENLSKEAAKLNQINEISFSSNACEILNKIPPKILRILSRRARNEKAGELKSHPAHIGYALLVCFLHT